MQMRGRMLHHGLGRSALQSRACARRPKPVRLRARDVGAPARGCWYTRARTPARSYGQDHTHVKKCFEQGMCTRRVVMGMLTGGGGARRRAGHVLRAAAHVRLPVARAVEGDAVHQEPDAGVYRLPGQAGRRRLQAARRLPAGVGALKGRAGARSGGAGVDRGALLGARCCGACAGVHMRPNLVSGRADGALGSPLRSGCVHA